jgi:hypothetical protein
MRRPALYLVLAVGLCGILAGGLFVGLYIVEAFVSRIDEPDQSLLYWYLPIAFMGLSFLLAGGVLAAWAWRSLRRPPPPPSQ